MKVKDLNEKTYDELESLAKKLLVEYEDRSKDELIKDIHQVILAEERKNYIDRVEMGTLVAFKAESGKVMSAKIIGRDRDTKRIKVITEYGLSFVVYYEDVLWVKTGKRWPKNIYNLLKGLKGDKIEEKE